MTEEEAGRAPVELPRESVESGERPAPWDPDIRPDWRDGGGVMFGQEFPRSRRLPLKLETDVEASPIRYEGGDDGDR